LAWLISVLARVSYEHITNVMLSICIGRPQFFDDDQIIDLLYLTTTRVIMFFSAQ
jgi:hypothetical protein